MKNILIYEKENFLNVSLNRPEKKNALDLKLIQSLTEFFLNKPDKIILLKGEGSCFCAGADLNWISSAPAEELEYLFQLFETVQSVEVPVLAYAHGLVYGGGIGLLSVCDFIFTENSTKFCFSELKLGLMPALIAPFILQKSPQIKEYMLNGKMFSAQQALKLNLIHFTGSIEECKKWKKDQVEALIKLHQGAFQETKKFLKYLPFVRNENIKKFCIQSLQKRRNDPFVENTIKKFLSKEPS